ncbi:hypothetical protein PHLCEN_2v13464 [Hermanssonia centrifuga]|uniref:Uncharacterized protein n=1 Tax=Hermanssonia centrifuga TaxID=98765 RepID=A0A2R6NEE9_9APHY|nr:hypothetical protein PHLCEN_2v13464 [Hermanssonia centrifuga]
MSTDAKDPCTASGTNAKPVQRKLIGMRWPCRYRRSSLLNVDKKTKVSVYSRDGTKHTLFAIKDDSQVITQFVVPIWDVPKKDKTRPNGRLQAMLSTATGKGRCHLLCLPAEMISMIFGEFEDVKDAVCLCLVDEWLSSVGMKSVRKLVARLAAPWSGDRVIHLGFHAADDDYPESVQEHVTAEVAAFKAKYGAAQLREGGASDSDESSSSDSDFEEPKKRKNPPRTIFPHVYMRYKSNYSIPRGVPDVEPYRVTRGCWTGYASIYEVLSPKDASRMKVMLRTSYTTSQGWALCNLSKKEYVRADEIAKMTKSTCRGPWIKHTVNLGMVLLLRTTWSSAELVEIKDPKGDMHRGVWAGDRFEITTLDRLKGGQKGWKDVSMAVVAEVDALCELNYGTKDWVTEIQEDKKKSYNE